MELLCDLHTHTTASDGSFGPEQLVEYALAKKAGAIAITDHDTLAGLAAAVTHARQIGQEVIPGVELTTGLEGCEIHIVGLFVDYTQKAFIAEVDRMSKTRDERNYRMVEQLAAAGFNITHSDLERYSGCILTKAHIGAVLIERGYADDLKEAMAKYLSRGQVGYVARRVPPPQDCIDLIHSAGGLAFVAHTNQIDRADRDRSVRLCRSLLEQGADGLETRYCEYDDDWRERTETLAGEYNLLRSGGSDFHGSYKKGLELISGYGDLQVPYSFVEEMKKRL